MSNQPPLEKATEPWLSNAKKMPPVASLLRVVALTVFAFHICIDTAAQPTPVDLTELGLEEILTLPIIRDDAKPIRESFMTRTPSSIAGELNG